MNVRFVAALLSLLASAPVFADNVYEYWGLMKPAGAENPWGLDTVTGTLFWLRMLTDQAAPDRDCCNPDRAEFDLTRAILFIGGRAANVSLVNVRVRFSDDVTYDAMDLNANVELDGVTLFVLFDVRIPPTAFDLNPAPGGADVPPLFANQFPVQFGAANSGSVVTFPDHEHAAFGSVDTDADGLADFADNCILRPNEIQSPSDAGQPDTDDDGYGNACDADFNNDCQTNFIDLSTMKELFFQTGVLQTDLNADGFTNFADLGIMKELFFLPPGPSAFTHACDPHVSRAPVR